MEGRVTGRPNRFSPPTLFLLCSAHRFKSLSWSRERANTQYGPKMMVSLRLMQRLNRGQAVFYSITQSAGRADTWLRWIPV